MPDALDHPQRIGRYRVESLVGEGAMADVYRAWDPSIDRPLAIKLLKRQFLTDRQYADRFLREAKAVGALAHPNIVTIFDVGEHEGVPFIVMELLDGRPLDRLLADGPVDTATALSIAAQLADALAYAHAQGVVHRDIKPSNVMVLGDRSVKLLDFGIARIVDALFEAESVRTQVGQVLGTPRYMSPEQALGHEVDGRADLFSVGVILYEMLSGKRAFPGASSATLAIQIVQRDPEPIGKVAPQTPGGVQFIVQKLLAKDPQRRFAGGQQLAAALRQELAALSAVRAEAEAHRSYIPLQWRLPILLGVITALVLLAAVGATLWRQTRAMEQVALASGDGISAFVAANAGLRAVENATLPPAQQDWAPTEAFVRAASDNPAVRGIIVAGADGVVRAATDARLVGRPFAAATGGEVVRRDKGVTVTELPGRDGRVGSYRFQRPITYAGQSFGQVDVEVGRDALEAASSLSRWLLLALGLVVLGTVAATSYFSARLLAQPIRRMKGALLEVARGNLDFRISHSRRDEFGELFDGFNVAAAAMEERVHAVERIALDTPTGASDAAMASAAAPLAPPSSEAAPAAIAQPAVETRQGPAAMPDEPLPAMLEAAQEPPHEPMAERAEAREAVAEPEPAAEAPPAASGTEAEAAPPGNAPVEAPAPVVAASAMPDSTAAEPASAAPPATMVADDAGDRTQIWMPSPASPASVAAPELQAPTPPAPPPPAPAPSAPTVAAPLRRVADPGTRPPAPVPPAPTFDDDDGGDTLIGPATRR